MRLLRQGANGSLVMMMGWSGTKAKARCSISKLSCPILVDGKFQSVGSVSCTSCCSIPRCRVAVRGCDRGITITDAGEMCSWYDMVQEES